MVLFAGFSLTGWILVGIALHTKRYQQKKEQNERAFSSGKIVDVVKKVRPTGRGRRAVYYVAVVEFEANRKLYRLESENGDRNRDQILIGKSVDVLYDENDPTHFHLSDDDANATASGNLMRSGAMIILGAGILTILDYVFHIL